MSRIHEALKKAALERSAHVGERPVLESAGLSVEGLASAVLKEVSPSTGSEMTLGAGAAREVLQFQEFTQRCAHPAWRIDSRYSAFSPGAHFPVGAERFRTLRSRLFQVAATRPVRRLVVTSSLPEEGKTFIASNLGQSFARQPECRVLLIDADLRASRLHIPFGAHEMPGLSDYLRGEANESQVTQVGPQGNLCLIPGGRSVSNPSELLHSDRMKLLLDKMSQVFDWIILDSPPALAVHDASLLADMCDGVLFVVRAGKTVLEIAEKASSEFRDKNLLGVVLNRVEKQEEYGGYYYVAHPDEKQSAGQVSQ